MKEELIADLNQLRNQRIEIEKKETETILNLVNVLYEEAKGSTVEQYLHLVSAFIADNNLYEYSQEMKNAAMKKIYEERIG